MHIIFKKECAEYNLVPSTVAICYKNPTIWICLPYFTEDSEKKILLYKRFLLQYFGVSGKVLEMKKVCYYFNKLAGLKGEEDGEFDLLSSYRRNYRSYFRNIEDSENK